MYAASLTSLSAPPPPAAAYPATVDTDVGLAHDTRNILAALALYCDLLEGPGVLQPEHRHYAAELRLLAARSGDLMQGILASQPTRVRRGQPHDITLRAEDSLASRTSATDPADTLREIAPLLSALAAPAATVTVKTPRTLPDAGLPAQALERIVVNLVRNAAQAIEMAAAPAIDVQRSGQVRVALAIVAGHLHLTVEDNGPGMPVATAAAFLSPSPLPRVGQHGLGHRIVHQLVVSSGGTLAVRVRPGRGTTFTLKWPLPQVPRQQGLSQGVVAC